MTTRKKKTLNRHFLYHFIQIALGLVRDMKKIINFAIAKCLPANWSTMAESLGNSKKYILIKQMCIYGYIL